MKPQVKKTVAAAAACLTAVTLFSANTAMAADTRIPAGDLAKAQPISVTASEDISRNTFAAIPLASYTYASTDGSAITGYDLATNADLTAAIDAALAASGATGYEPGDPMLWVVQNLLDSTESPWAGQLRDFVDQLKNQQAIKDATGTPLAPVAGDVNTQSADVTPGVYLVLDRTADGKAAIAGLNATGINGMTELKTASGTYTLGSVEYKVHDVTKPGKKITAVEDDAKGDVNGDGLSADVEQGRMVTMELSATVPNWTGYDKYYLAINDQYTGGLTFDEAKADMTVTVDGKALDAQYWHVTDAKDGSFTLRFGTADGDIIANKDLFPVDGKIVVSYKMLVDKDAVAGTVDTNTMEVEYSHNPNTWTDHATKPGDTVNVYTGKTIVTKTDMNGTPLAGAEFQLLDNGTPRQVVETAEGRYRMPEPGETGTDTLKTDKNGRLEVNGTDGDYVLKETKSPFDNPLLPDANITVAVDDKTGAVTTSETGGDANQMIEVKDNGEIGVMNARTLLEMPKTGATWLAIIGTGCAMALAAGLLLLKRYRMGRA